VRNTGRVDLPTLRAGDLVLRRKTPGDAEALVAACQDPEIPRWTRVPAPYTEATAREWAAQARVAEDGGHGLHLLVVDAASDELLGSAGLVRIDWEEARGEVGYWLAREARGRGVATGAVRMVSRWAFENLAIERLEIHTEPDNHRSRRVAERAGYKFEGVLRSYFVNKGRRRDAASYSLIRGELPS
jgi:RimJ/RimL family protein N-acetyltransferase